MRRAFAIGLCVILACTARADEKKGEPIDGKILLGKWQQVEPRDGPQITMEFSADGKVGGTVAIGGGLTGTFTGTYKLDGNKIAMKTVLKVKNFADQKADGGGTITKLTTDVCEFKDLNAMEIKLKRVSAK